MARGLGGEGGAAGGRDPNAGGRGPSGGPGGRGGGNFGERFGVGGFGGGSRGIGGEGGAAGGRDPNAGGRVGGGNGGRGGNTFSGMNPVGNDTTATKKRADQAGVTPDQYNQEVSDYAARIRDSLNSDNTPVEDLANLFAGAIGFNEQPPEDLDFDPVNPVGPRAGWGFDPVGALAGIGGMLGGVPFGPGLIADKISSLLGRPLEISLGPSVFGSDELDENGQPTGNTTHTGGSMTVRDADNPNEFFGVSPGLGMLGQGATNTVPRRQTYTGADPAPVDQAPDTPPAPVTPNPSPIDTPPGGVQVDPGNTGLTPQQLTDLFAGFMKPQTRTASGRNSARLVV